jgi:hypothetical protein
MYFDLENRLRTDGQFQEEFQRRQERLARLEQLLLRDQGHLAEYHQVLRELLEFCQFNIALLTPYFWPAYPKNKPLLYSNYPFSFQLFSLQIGGFTVIRGSRQISKTTSFACRQQMMARLLRGFRSLYVTPRHEQLQTYKNKFRELEKANRFFQRNTHLRQNLGYKEHENGSIVEMAYVLTSAAGIRGKSTDELLFDEYQNFDPELELEVLQTQSASEMRITLYAGTSLTTDSALEARWNESSQASWVMKCSACNHHNIPLPEFGVMDMIQAPGPCCAKCGKILNVRTGGFVHAFPRLRDVGYVGFHIPQLIVPAVVYNPVRWADIYRMKNRVGGSRQFQQEVLGIATEEGEKEISRKQLEAICTLGSDLEPLRLKAQRDYRWVVSGCDWGGSDYIPELRIKKSTTVHVIMGVLPSGQLDVLHMRRYSGMNYDDIIGDILHNHFAYQGYALASDFGVGAVYNSKLRQKIPPERHLMFCYTGPTTELLAEPEGTHQYNQWSLNKTESISLIFDAIRQQRIRCFAWEIAQEYLQDCLNLFRAPGERGQSGGAGSGMKTFIYRSHPTRPNDTLMALNYGFTLGRLLLGEPMLADLSVKIRLEAQLQGTWSDLNYPDWPGAISG